LKDNEGHSVTNDVLFTNGELFKAENIRLVEMYIYVINPYYNIIG